MDNQKHWENVYQTKAPDAVSWYRPHLEKSLALIQRAAPGKDAAILDVGGGESTLIDDLLALKYRDVTVLDISATAVHATQQRLGHLSRKAHWLIGDITEIDLPMRRYDVWHDRAVFHFLTLPEHRAVYVRQVAKAVKPGGHVIVATFGPDGPEKCSGLEVARYDAESLHGQFGADFRLLESQQETHQTPFGSAQQFVYCFCKLV